jgi:hypothetical protein
MALSGLPTCSTASQIGYDGSERAHSRDNREGGVNARVADMNSAFIPGNRVIASISLKERLSSVVQRPLNKLGASDKAFSRGMATALLNSLADGCLRHSAWRTVPYELEG